MTQPITESYIKKYLDGWFMRYSPNTDRFELRRVPPDFIPDHENQQAKAIAKCLATWRRDPNRKMGRNTPKDATPEETTRILMLYDRGNSMADIHKILKCQGSKVSYRGVADIVKARP